MLNRPKNQSAPLNRSRFGSGHRLSLERLEERAMMDGVPVLNSLPTAPKTIYLDFDGDYQPVWNRTDSAQTYLNVVTGPYDADKKAGFSASELADIRAIWAGVAEDYSPFNVNVTTVEPPAAAFQTNQALRVVIAGAATAQLYDPHFIPGTLIFTAYDTIGGTSFITDNKITPTGNSGYSALNSFSSGEPNVVFVFSSLIRGWSATDQEGNVRNFDAVIATTASHEAGHAFNLVHHAGKDGMGNASPYDVGNLNTTPIMGSNGESDRTVWSTNSTQDTMQILTAALGARPDDFSNSYVTPSGFTSYGASSSSTGIWTSTFDVQGFISKATDADYFKFTSNGGYYSINADPVAMGNLDIRMDVYQSFISPVLGNYVVSLGTFDPAIPTGKPFSGLNAAMATRYLAKGDYLICLSSHGTYGDLGQYSLHVFGTNLVPTGLATAPVTTSPILAIATGSTSVGSSTPQTTKSSGGVSETTVTRKTSTAQSAKAKSTDALFGDLAHLAWLFV